MWIIMEENRIRHRWECPECDRNAYVSSWFYSEYGTPVCVECPDQDMEYVRVELEIEK